MAPREETKAEDQLQLGEEHSSTSAPSIKEETKQSSTLDHLGIDAAHLNPGNVHTTKDGNTFYRLDLSDAEVIEKIALHREKSPSAAKAVNQHLNLNLGLPLNPDNPSIRKFARILSDVNVVTEKIAVAIWMSLPLWFRHKMAKLSWLFYSAIHKFIVGRRSAIHRDATPEYHAMTTVMYWGRFFPVTIKRMRLALNQIQVNHPPSSDVLKHKMEPVIASSNTTGVEGIYLNLQSKKTPTETPRVILWLFGGAFIAGDVEGNIGIAEKIGRQCNADVFVANYRLLPENEFDDAVDDVYRSYLYLINERQIPSKSILVYGISSGGGLAVKLIQEILSDNKRRVPTPGGAVLMCPFVDYMVPVGSTKEYVKHDLIVNQSVFETGIPFFEIKLGSLENRKKASPVHGAFDGFPPVCIVVSEHEICFDQCMLLAHRIQKAGRECSVGIWKYMCHTFPVLSPFIPEGEQAQNFMCDWMINHYDKNGSK